jgi:hypothetical protein
LTYPSNFSKSEQAEPEADVDGVVRGMEAMRSIRQGLGELFPEQGIVKPEDYEEALEALAQMKEQVIDEFATNAAEREAWRKAWPFGT